MARSKKKKQNTQPVLDINVDAAANTHREATDTLPASPGLDINLEKKPGKPQRPQAAASHDLPLEMAQTPPRRGMPYGTAILAMILTFVLGCVVGSVAPQWLQQHNMLPPGMAGGMTAGMQNAAPAPQKPAPAPQQAAQEDHAHEQHVIQDLEKQIASDPANRELFVKLGNACFDAHQHERAIQAYERALELSPDDPDVLTDLGIMYRETKAFEKALESFRKAQALNPKHSQSAFNEGIVLLYDLQRKDEALACWQRILADNPSAMAPNGRPLADLVKELQ